MADQPDVTNKDELLAGLAALVGIGVGSDSLDSLERFAQGVDPELGAAYLVVPRQGGLAADAITQVMARAGTLAVRLTADDQALEPNTVYVVAPDAIVTVDAGRIRSRIADDPNDRHGAIDTLLISLAEQAGERAVAILLVGLGSDGTAGITATKQFGGLSIAELDGEEATGPDVAGPSGVVDLHLRAEAMPGQIALYAASLSQAGSGEEDIPDEIDAHVRQVTAILRNVTGHDFHGYKRGTFVRRVQRRMQVHQIESTARYIARLRDDTAEVQNLFQDLLIGVTQFFRDPAEFEALERELPRLFEGKGPDDQFRVWVLGCATGEEAYSLAILLREHMATLEHPCEVQIFATDLDARALGLARTGRYTDAIARHVRPDRLDRWFVREGDTYCVVKELREMCIFSPHNIVKDAPFSRLDLLSCRNLLIYLDSDLQNRVIPIFHFALRSGGVLFLGNSENVTRHGKLFAPVDRKVRLFRRLDTAMRIVPDFPLSARVRSAASTEPAIAPAGGRLNASIGRQAEAIADRYAPAYVVVDLAGDVLHFSGRTGRFIEQPAGAPTLNLPSIAHRDLRLDIRSALAGAIATGERVEQPRLPMRHDGGTNGVTLVVEPIGGGGEPTSLMVIFQDLGPIADEGARDGERPRTDEHVHRLEAELRVTRERLQATIEEQESTNEELKSSNEEFQSINEEMQSANEELETSKEELQSVNEELHTVNGELGHRVGELDRANSDLKNLLESTRIATVFLDRDLRVRNFTPATTEIFHLLETDVGRPLDHVVSRVAYPELPDDVRRVLKSLVPQERQVADGRGRQYIARVLPYRSVGNYIDGAVVTFTDLTEVHRAQQAVREGEARFRAFVTADSDIVYRMGPDWSEMRYLEGSQFLTDTEDPSYFWMEKYIHPDDRNHVKAAIDAAIAGKTLFALEHRVRRADGTLGWVFSRAVPILDDRGEIVEWLGAGTDVTERHQAALALAESERRQQVLIEGMRQLVWRAVDGGKWTWASPQWTECTGQSEQDSLDLGWLDVVHPDDRDGIMAAWHRAPERGGISAEFRIRNARENRWTWFQWRAAPVRDDAGRIVEWLGTSTDIDRLHTLQERQGVLVAELQHRVRNMLTVVRSVFAQTVEAGGSVADMASHFQGRLDSLARTQVIVTRNADGLVDLESLIREELLSVGATDGPQVVIEGPEVQITPVTAESIGLAIHELATNALKYGALKVAGASLSVRWHNIGEGESRALNLVWTEQGVPAVPIRPQRQGFGRELIEEALPYRLGAETKLEFLGGGVRCSITVPLSQGGGSTEEALS